jgi:hypothetical protein
MIGLMMKLVRCFFLGDVAFGEFGLQLLSWCFCTTATGIDHCIMIFLATSSFLRLCAFVVTLWYCVVQRFGVIGIFTILIYNLFIRKKLSRKISVGNQIK